MKKLYFTVLSIMVSSVLFSQAQKIIVLNQPETDKGLTVMKALAERYSERNFDTVDLKLQDLSNLVWAADGINRKESGKRTAPSSMNSQEIDVYVALKSGVYFYNANQHSLELVSDSDIRPAIADRQAEAAKAPVFLILVGDISKVKYGNDSEKINTAATDAGIISQNISLFCASMGFSTVPRGTMNKEKLKEALKLKDTQYLMLNHPVSYKNQ